MADAARGGGAGADAHLIVGTFRRPHGVRGHFVLRPETGHAEQVFRPGRSLLVGDAEGRPTGRTLTLDRVRPFKEGLLVEAAEVQSREAADALRGTTLLIPAGEAAPREEDELFHHELVGLAVLAHGEAVGTVLDVLELPGGETLVVRRPGRRDLLLPFVREMIERVDLEAGELHVRPPEGLLEL